LRDSGLVAPLQGHWLGFYEMFSEFIMMRFNRHSDWTSETYRLCNSFRKSSFTFQIFEDCK